MSQSQSTENVVFHSVIGAVLIICALVSGTLFALSYSDTAIEKEKQTINHFIDGKVIVCKPNLTPITNKDWKYDTELKSFTKDVEIFKALNCQLRK